MLKAHRARTTFPARLGVAALGLGALTLTATSGIAADPPTIQKVERIVITKKDGAQSGDSEVAKLVAERCAGAAARQESQSQVVEGGETKTRRVIVCQSDGKAGELSVTQLESARASLATSDKLKPEDRARVLSALDAAIADAKARR